MGYPVLIAAELRNLLEPDQLDGLDVTWLAAHEPTPTQGDWVAIVPLLSRWIGGEDFKNLPKLRIVANVAVGYNNVDVVAAELRDGNLVCIFPEGRLTRDGEIGEFRAGMMRILKETPVPVIPMGVSGLWDSMFSRKYQAVWKRWPRRFLPKITLTVGSPIPPEQADLASLRQRVVELRGPLELGLGEVRPAQLEVQEAQGIPVCRGVGIEGDRLPERRQGQ